MSYNLLEVTMASEVSPEVREALRRCKGPGWAEAPDGCLDTWELRTRPRDRVDAGWLPAEAPAIMAETARLFADESRPGLWWELTGDPQAEPISAVLRWQRPLGGYDSRMCVGSTARFAAISLLIEVMDEVNLLSRRMFRGWTIHAIEWSEMGVPLALVLRNPKTSEEVRLINPPPAPDPAKAAEALKAYDQLDPVGRLLGAAAVEFILSRRAKPDERRKRMVGAASQAMLDHVTRGVRRETRAATPNEPPPKDTPAGAGNGPEDP